MDAERRRALAARVLERSPADATEVIVMSGREALTRFTHELIHQNIDVDNTVVRVRAIAGGRSGVASTNALDEPALDAAIARANEIAALVPAQSPPPTLAGAASIASPSGAYVATTAAASAVDRSAVAAAIFGHAARNGLWSAGFVTTASRGITIATSAGADASFDGTDCGVNVKMSGPDSTGFAERYGTDAAVLDGAAVGARAAHIARSSAEPIAVEPGEWTVILEPAALGELLAFLGHHFSAQAYDEGSSFLSGRLGRRLLGENVTLRDDYAHPLHPGMPFDWEGTPKQAVTLVERGVARELVTDRNWSRKLARPNTGHGLPAPNAYGPQPNNLVLDPGSASLEELIATTARGLLVTRLWYVRIVDQLKTILTGMTRDGTFLIENGKVTRGVHNLRFNQSIVDALTSCTLGREQVRTGSYHYSLVAPAVRFDRFNFASTTAY